MVRSAAQARADAVTAREMGADLVELRVDEFYTGAESGEVAGLIRECAAPAILTCRSEREGGSWRGTDSELAELYAAGVEAGVSYVDVELAVHERAAGIRALTAKLGETRLILSMHDWNGRPPDLLRRVSRMQAVHAAAVIKVAYRARSVRDNIELLDLLRGAGKPMIALGMGEFGVMSRVLAGKFGAFLTFASLRPAAATAPGQPTVRELLDLYRFRAVGRATRVYGVIGWPVEHSRSPAVHNAGFAAVEHDGVYVPLPVPGGEDRDDGYAAFKATVLEFLGHEGLDFAGASVTAPHKQNLARLAREQGWNHPTDTAGTGAANTIIVGRDGITVTNTDVAAVRDSLARALGVVAPKRVAVLGAGGMARAAALACARAGADVVVYSRTRERGVALVDDLSASGFNGKLTWEPWTALESASADAFINCTTVGMTGGGSEHESPLPESVMAANPGAVMIDSVYAPAPTPLLAASKRAGLRTVGGEELFIRQAALQFAAWTGKQSPVNMFGKSDLGEQKS